MQVNVERGKAASGVRSIGRFVAILAGVPLVATLALSAPNTALAAQCGTTHPGGGGVHTGTGGGVHATTSTPASGGGGGGGGGTLGCANGSSAQGLRGLPVASSGRVVENGARAAGHTGVHARTAATKTANTGAHPRGVRPPHA